MNPLPDIANDLRGHADLCQELLAVIEREGQALRRPPAPALSPFYQEKKRLLPRLDASLNRLRQNRLFWQKRCSAERGQSPEVCSLLRQNRDMIMKIILQDRENEQLLLRQGLSPASQLPSAERPRPHMKADLYRRPYASGSTPE